MMRNPICYIGGDSFPNIFGGNTACEYGSVDHLLELNKTFSVKWPYLQDKFVYSTAMGHVGAFKTWNECKTFILEKHPNATFVIYWKDFRSSFPDATLMEVKDNRS